jgi:5'-nucleotidase
MSHGRRLTILHTNDFHNHLTDGQAAFIRQRRVAEGPNSLLLDAGDAISAGNVGVRLGGEPILSVMHEAGYDAMTLGNREFHVADSLLRHKISSAQFPVLCANIRYQTDMDENLPVVPYLVKSLSNGLRVTVIGLTVPMVTSRMAARFISSYLFDDPVESAILWVSKLRADTDVLIALTHIGYKEDQRLAKACPDFDLIVGGHSHVVLDQAQVVGTVPIVQAGWFGHYLGQVDLFVESSGVTVTSSTLDDLRNLRKVGP